MSEETNPNPDQQPSEEEFALQFLDIALLFFNQGVLALGMAPHPATGEVYLSFEAAQESIAILDVLKEKSQGNLSAEEETALAHMIDELKMAFVHAIRDPRARELAEKTRQMAAQPPRTESKILTPDGRPASTAAEKPKIIIPGM